MRNKIIGNIALACSPIMMIGMNLGSNYSSWFTGLWGLIYISAWTAMVLAIKDAFIAGKNSFARSFMYILLASLTIANVSNLINLFELADAVPFFFYLDLFWPISHSLMFILGIMVLIHNTIRGWKKFAPLVFGSWFPVAMLLMTIGGDKSWAIHSIELYNLIGYASLALLIRSIPDPTPVSRDVFVNWNF